MPEQGSPPSRPSGQPGYRNFEGTSFEDGSFDDRGREGGSFGEGSFDDRGLDGGSYADRTPDDRSRQGRTPGGRGHGGRSPLERGGRLRRAERPERAGWGQGDPFAPEADAELPSWAAPTDYSSARPADLPRRAGRGRPDSERGHDGPEHDRPGDDGPGYGGGSRHRRDDRRSGQPQPADGGPGLRQPQDDFAEAGYRQREDDLVTPGRHQGTDEPGYRRLEEDVLGSRRPGRRRAGESSDYRQPAEGFRRASHRRADDTDLTHREPDAEWQDADPVGVAPGYRQAAVDELAYQPSGAGAGYADRASGHRNGAAEADAESEAPDWTRPARERPARRVRSRGRAAAARLRKSRRRVYRWGGIGIAACILAAVIVILTHHSPKPPPYVTELLPGEFKSAPSACTSVSAAVLNQYLPEPGRTSTKEISGGGESQCSFILDRKPTFLELEVTAQAYQPFAAATAAGSKPGSASANAQDDFVQLEQALIHPAKGSVQSAAQITRLAGLGQQAFVAVATVHVPKIVSKVVKVIVRERNVLITVSMTGQVSGPGFGPVSIATLQSGAEAAARDVLAKAQAQPTA